MQRAGRLRCGHARLFSSSWRLDAMGEDLIGQVSVCECLGELQGAEHQSEERDRVGLSRAGVCRVPDVT